MLIFLCEFKMKNTWGSFLKCMPSKYNATEVKMLQRNYSDTMNVQFATESLGLELFQEITRRVRMLELWWACLGAEECGAAVIDSCSNKGLKTQFYPELPELLHLHLISKQQGTAPRGSRCWCGGELLPGRRKKGAHARRGKSPSLSLPNKV